MASTDPFTDYLSKLAGSVVVHPITFSRILVQLGWEPDPPVLGLNLFRRQKLYYPNMFRHMGRVRDEVGGVFYLWTTGLGAKLVSQVVREVVLRGVESGYGGGEKNWEINSQSLGQLAQRCCYSSVSRSIAVVVAYPFHSVMVRQMAAAVSHDAVFRGNMFSVAKEIFDTEGLPGFFQGVSVAIVGDLLALWGTSIIAYALNRYVFAEMLKTEADLKQVSPLLASFLVSSWTYRYGVVSTNLCIRRSSGLALSVPYTGTNECWQALKLAGGLNRGDGLFYRTAPASAAAGAKRLASRR